MKKVYGCLVVATLGVGLLVNAEEPKKEVLPNSSAISNVQTEKDKVKTTENSAGLLSGLKKDSSLVIHYTFEEGNGSLLVNRAGGDKAKEIGGLVVEETSTPTVGRITGGKWLKEGSSQDKWCLEFNGKGTDSVKCGNAPEIGDLRVKTISFWLFVEKATYAKIISKTGTENTPAFTPGWSVGLHQPQPDGSLSLNYSQNYDGHAGHWGTPNNIKSGKWHHVVVIHDDRNPPAAPVFYIDGEKQPLQGYENANGAPLNDSKSNMTLGCMTNNNAFPLNGRLGELMFFKRILSEDEIRAISSSKY